MQMKSNIFDFDLCVLCFMFYVFMENMTIKSQGYNHNIFDSFEHVVGHCRGLPRQCTMLSRLYSVILATVKSVHCRGLPRQCTEANRFKEDMNSGAKNNIDNNSKNIGEGKLDRAEKISRSAYSKHTNYIKFILFGPKSNHKING